MSNLTSAEKENIYNRIQQQSVKENDCLVWTGRLENGLCVTEYKGEVFSLLNFVWNYHNSNNIIDRKSRCKRICLSDKCLNINHLEKKTIKQVLTKADIWDKMSKHGVRQNGCLVWQKDRRGKYGSFSIQGKTHMVHRLSYLVHNDIENIPDDLVIRHQCNNKLCFEPNHLKIGTQSENMEDRITSGTAMRGEHHPKAVITEEIAKAIKLSKREGKVGLTQKERAIKFGTSLGIVQAIDSGKSWGHLKNKEGETSNKGKVVAKQFRDKANKRVWTTNMFEKAKEKLLAHTQLSEDVRLPFVTTKCHIWKGGPNKSGDIRTEIRVYGKLIKGHILACEINTGRHKKKEEITRHICGVSLCCNPTHLKFGTHHENSVDALQHGTVKFAKLNAEKVKEIRTFSGLNGKEKQNKAKELSQKYNVSLDTIYNVFKKRTWQHVE
jgi:hypothetical protein